jgi:ubiquinone/menaquinone biosynthesis C-methylase UbiE
MKKDVTLLMTATIEVANPSLVKRNDTATRLKDYEGSLRRWLNDQASISRIVFAENSGYTFETLKKIVAAENPNNISVEFLRVPPTSIEQGGISIGELRIIAHALAHSSLLKESEHFIKITGRVFVENIDKLIEAIPQDHHMVSFFSENLSYVDSVLIFFHTQFYREIISERAIFEMMNPNGRIDFERAMAKAFHRAMASDYRWYPFAVLPILSGMTGTKNTSYGKKYSWRYSLWGSMVHRWFYRLTRTVFDERRPRKHLLSRWKISSAYDQPSVTHDELGYIDALKVVEDSSLEVRQRKTAKQHIHRYKFANRFVSGKKILDVACGAGYGSKLMDRAASYTGVDIEPEAVKTAIQSYGQSETRKFLSGNACLIDSYFPNESFDVVVSFETIEHFRKYDRFLDAVHRCLKPRGQLIVSTPNRNVTNPGKSLSDPAVWEHHTQEWIEEEFLSLLKKHGFQVQGIYGQYMSLLPEISRWIRGGSRLLRALTLGVWPLSFFRPFSQANYLIVRATKH